MIEIENGMVRWGWGYLKKKPCLFNEIGLKNVYYESDESSHRGRRVVA